MDLQSTIRVFNETELTSVPGIGEGQRLKVLTGNDQRPSERMMVFVKSFDAGSHEILHWHLIEVFYYIISGRGVLRDIMGKTYDLSPGTAIYAPPGIAGSHEWEITEPLQLIGFRSTGDGAKMMQFTVDKETKESSIALEYLRRWGGTEFKRSLY